MSERPEVGGPRGWALALVVLLPRLAVFPWNENLAGDAIVRTWLAHGWLGQPHLIGSFAQGSLQFGPLHLYLLALAELVVPALEHSGRVVSFVAGALTAVPLFSLTRRLFGRPAAAWAVVGFGLWGLHVQVSTTAASEALNLSLVTSALALVQAWRDEGRREALLGAALALNLACATRYDSWLLVPLVAATVAWHCRSLPAGAWFAVASSAFSVPWLVGNWLDEGHPLYPFVFIDDFHRAWFPSEVARWGAFGYRLICLGFWPGAALVTLTPLVALAGMLGLRRAWRERRDTRWLVLLVVVPPALYAGRAVLFSSFVPLVRFTMKEVLLLLPFAWFGAQPVLSRLSLRGRRATVAVAVACAVAWPAWLGWFCFRTEGAVPDTLRPIAPTSTNPPRLMRVARWLRDEGAAGTDGVLVDRDPRDYDDINVAFFSGFPYERIVRRRSVLFEQRVATNRIGYVVRFEGGQLEAEGRLQVGAGGVTFDGQRFVEVGGFEPPIHVYRRAP
ncbi:MAG: glycosyltransferase family 39 protein [Myxococcota bacterium]|jgi:4-amino-4-deoxy-L-arabinose transferase-like glycosyltransferase